MSGAAGLNGRHKGRDEAKRILPKELRAESRRGSRDGRDGSGRGTGILNS